MDGYYYFLVLGPLLAGVVVALVWWLIRGPRTRVSDTGVTAFSLVAGLLLVLGALAPRLASNSLLPIDLPMEFWFWYMDHRFAIPLALGIVGVALLAFPLGDRRGRGVAELTPRTPLSYTRRWWLGAAAMVVAIILVLTLAAGAASQPDPQTGHYTMYFVDLGAGNGMGTNIYGWYSSIPSLILLAIMTVVAVLILFLIARPPLGESQEQDIQLRIIRSRNVLTVVAGALLLHLGTILGSLAGTASMRGQFQAAGGTVSSWTEFAALEPALRVASEVAAGFGIAFWLTVALSTIPSRRKSRVAAES